MTPGLFRVVGLATLLFASACAPYHETVSTEQLLAENLTDDNDGVDASVDACPRAPEDMDGFEDGDGCPDADNDHDGWVDARDACPTEPGGKGSKNGCKPIYDADSDGIVDDKDACKDVAETKNGYRDEDGCPDVKVAVVDGRVAPDGKLEFEPGTVNLTAASAKLLPEIAWFLGQHAELAKVEIGVHTDDVGADKANLKLSISQANALRDALIAAGVAADRLTAAGYGETKPLVKATTEDARAQNRRVELVVK